MYPSNRLFRTSLFALSLVLHVSLTEASERWTKTVRLEPQRTLGAALLRPKLVCSGALTPTVILDNSGEAFSTWTRVVPLVKERSRVCVWNQGVSLTPEQDAVALAKALKLAGEEPPYIRVATGHGSESAARFAAQSPTEVRGLIFVDALPLTRTIALDAALPLVVISSTQVDDSAWQDAQASLTTLSTVSTQLLSPQGRGSLLDDAPDVVAEGLDWILRYVRLDETTHDAASDE